MTIQLLTMQNARIHAQQIGSAPTISAAIRTARALACKHFNRYDTRHDSTLAGRYFVSLDPETHGDAITITPFFQEAK